MPIQAIILQPAAAGLYAAYRPIVFRVEAIRTDGASTADVPPVVFCDCYVRPRSLPYPYYKSLSRTQAILGDGTRYFQFDIQDAVQECLSTVLGPYAGTQLLDLFNQYIKACFVRFRSSGYDSDGLLQTEDVAPVQATGNSAGSGGTGTDSNTFYVLNATLQHQNNQDLAMHLDSFKQGTWDAAFLPVTHRPARYFVTPDDSDFFPVYMPAGHLLKYYQLAYRFTNQSTVWTADVAVAYPGLDPVTSAPIIQDYFETFTDPTVLYVPSGPANLQSLFPTISFRDIAEYSIRLLDGASDVVAESTKHQVVKYDDRVRIHFQNYLGTVDAMNFNQVGVVHESKSELTQRPLSYPLDKAQHSLRRFNVKSNDSYSAISVEYDENQQAWIDELLDSPSAWMEVPAIEDQPAGYMPIVITDRKAEKRKVEDRWVYEVTLEFKLSNERIIIRN